jgi:hypothetical protein
MRDRVLGNLGGPIPTLARLELDVVDHGAEDRLRHECGPRVVEVQDGRTTRRLGTRPLNVDLGQKPRPIVLRCSTNKHIPRDFGFDELAQLRGLLTAVDDAAETAVDFPRCVGAKIAIRNPAGRARSHLHNRELLVVVGLDRELVQRVPVVALGARSVGERHSETSS